MLPDSSVKQQGFTLVEILIVIVILGILAGIVIPSFCTASDEANRNTFAANLKTFHKAAVYYHLKNNQLPADGSTGVVPAGMEDYINGVQWASQTPMGGYWDTELTDGGTTSWIGVHYKDGASTYPQTSDMQEIDAIIDDGNLNTGSFVRFGPCQYFMRVN